MHLPVLRYRLGEVLVGAQAASSSGQDDRADGRVLLCNARDFGGELARHHAREAVEDVGAVECDAAPPRRFVSRRRFVGTLQDSPPLRAPIRRRRPAHRPRSVPPVSETAVESPNLDSLRATAVLTVFLAHLLIGLGVKPPEEIGAAGVLIFFVHTSLVLMMSLSRLESRGESLVKAFYIRRFFRIYPLAVVCVATIVIFHLPRAPWWPQPPLSLSTIVANLTLTTNLVYKDVVTSPLWSLPIEVQMYVALPFIYLIGRRYGLNGIIVIVVLACVAGRILPRVSGRLDIASYAPAFMAGVLTYFMGYGRRARPLPFIVWPLTVIAGILYFAYGAPRQWPRIVDAWGLCFLIALVAPFCRELTFKPLAQAAAIIAKYSYGIYLTHLYAIWVAFVVLKGQSVVLQWATLVVLFAGLPVLLFHTVESPMIGIGARIAKRFRARGAAATGAGAAAIAPGSAPPAT
jgi:peptidoglycan/LPS O-acetylase OafA/YrhL